MKSLSALIVRNIKLFFKDKGMLFTSLVTPMILLVLYATFLSNVYRDAFTSSLPVGVTLDKSVINGVVAGQLVSSLLAVSCVTVAFCSSFLMVQDKVSGARKDFLMSPVKKSTLAVSYSISTFCCTLVICLFAVVAGLIYIAVLGWYLSAVDVIFIILDVCVLSLFGTILSSVINLFLNTQGQISAVGTIVSAGYGFICGAYMPISSFSSGLQSALAFLPGTYGTSLLRNHFLNGVFRKMASLNVPSSTIDAIKQSVDCSISFFGNTVSIGAMYGVLCVAVLLLLGAYILLNYLAVKRDK